MRVRLLATLVLLAIGLACLAAAPYARFVSGTDPFRSTPMATVDGRPVLADDPRLGTVPIGPGWRGPYLLGADDLGRDVAARLLFGGRTSLLIAAAATALCLLLGTAAGVLAGFVGGAVDAVLSGLLDLVWAFPVYLLAISVAVVLVDDGLRLGPLTLSADSLFLPAAIIGLVYIPYVARPVRAEVRALRTRDFVEAAIATGCGAPRILRRHILPLLWPTLLGLLPAVAAAALLTEAALSILGIGVQPPAASWGTLIADGQTLIYSRPWVAVAPGLAVAITVLALNVVADRD